jgi:hypothetical protein
MNSKPQSTLLHIRPQMYAPSRFVELVALSVEPLGIRLSGHALRTGRPYSNKRFSVGRLRKGRAAMDGILIEATALPNEFDMLARWAVAAEIVVTHRVHYQLLDREFDAASDDMTLWHSTDKSLGGWSRRLAPWAQDLSPMKAEPIMEIDHPATFARVMRKDTVKDGVIIERRETFPMMTIERGRLLDNVLNDRIPPIGFALQI